MGSPRRKPPPPSDAARAMMYGNVGVAKAPTPIQNAQIAPGSQPRHWTTRKAGECAFPVYGLGADVHSCCLPRAENALGWPYCSHHAKIMRRPRQ